MSKSKRTSLSTATKSCASVLLLPLLMAGCSGDGVGDDPNVQVGTGGNTTSATGGTSSGGGLGSGGAGNAPASGGAPGAGGGLLDGSGGALDGSGGTDPGGTGGATVVPGDTYFTDWTADNDPDVVGLRLAKVFDGKNLQTLEDSKHYKVACAWYGALSVAAVLGEQELLDSLIAKYDPYKGTWSSLLGGQGHVDDNVFGIVPLEISLHDEDAVYLTDGLSIADHQQANIGTQKRFATDDMFMITGLQVQAFRASQDIKYLNLAASVMVEYLNQLQQADGMFFHHQDFQHKWGRGNGWFAAGMAELIRELPETNADYAAVREGYEKMMAGLLSYQIKDGAGAGLWKQIVDSDDARNWPETSGSAMFTYAIISGVRAGWLDPETYGPAGRAGWEALVGKLNGQGLLSDISDWAYKPSSHAGGPSYAGDEENYYFERPKLVGDDHGQAPMMWIAAELSR